MSLFKGEFFIGLRGVDTPAVFCFYSTSYKHDLNLSESCAVVHSISISVCNTDLRNIVAILSEKIEIKTEATIQIYGPIF